MPRPRKYNLWPLPLDIEVQSAGEEAAMRRAARNTGLRHNVYVRVEKRAPGRFYISVVPDPRETSPTEAMRGLGVGEAIERKLSPTARQRFLITLHRFCNESGREFEHTTHNTPIFRLRRIK